MTPQQLSWIKSRQREYKELFGSRLEIDWAVMNGMAPLKLRPKSITVKADPHVVGFFDRDKEEENLKMICIKYGTTLDTVRSTKRITKTRPNEWKAVREFSTHVFKNNLPFLQCCKLINKDITLYNYYGYNKEG